MKKNVLFITLAAIALSTVLFFSSCSDDENTFALLGYWQCSGIGANVLGNSSPAFEEEYFKYFSIGFVGTNSSGKFYRVGTDNLTDLASVLTEANFSSLKKLLSAGDYTCSDGTITLTTSGGESTIYDYSINGKTLKLTEKTESLSGVGNIFDILNDLFDVDVDPTVGIEYSYEKLSGKEAFNSLFSSDK